MKPTIEPTIDMTVSPYDRGAAAATASLVQLAYKPRPRWVPSRFNARTVADDGRLILWNTFSGSISIFPPKDRERVLALLSPHGVEGPLGKAATSLSDRGFLVRDDVNELDLFRYRYAQGQWRSDTLQLILLASEDCNFRCVYCYEKFKRGTMTPETRAGIRAMVMKRAPQLKDLHISWFGGEPLYGWEAVEELAPFFKDVADRFGLSHGQSMTTNAYLLTPDRAAKLVSWGCTQFQITIDGLPEEHDCKRVGRDGSPTYATILENLRALKRLPEQYTVALRVNFDQENVPRLGPFIEALSEDFGGDPRFVLRFRAVGKWGGPNDEDLSTCGMDEQRAAVSQLRATATRMNMHQEGGIAFVSKFGAQVCYAARPYNFIVGASGKLMKCTIALEELEANVVGQIHPDGTMEIDDARLARWVYPHFEDDRVCRNCYVLPGCQGVSCPLSRVAHGNRSCCATKSELKRSMRFTLAEVDRQRAAAAAPEAEPALAGG